MKRAIARAIIDVRQSLREPICIAGFPRSGTTWLSTTLAAAPGTRTYHEPFNPVTVPRAEKFDFPYAAASHEHVEFDEFVVDAFAGRVEGPHVEMSLARRYRRFPGWPGRMVVKTVFGILALERVSVISGAQVVVIVRNPLDVAASWHRLDWNVERHLESLRTQPQLIDDHLEPFEHLLVGADDFWTQFGALWGASHLVLRRWLARNPDWIIVPFDALCADPVGMYRRLFRRLGLRWSQSQADRVRRTSRTASNKPFRPERVAKRQVGKWRRDGLNPEDVGRLRDVLAVFDDAAPDVNPSIEPSNG